MNNQFDENTRLSHAINFAIDMHKKSGQTREDKMTPYYVHILRVIERLQKIGKISDNEILIACALHDVVEDCGITYEEIGKQFGEQVMKYVQEVTIAPGESRESSAYVEKLRTASIGGKTIKLADKLDNVWELRVQKYQSYGGMPPQEYNNNAKVILEACKDGHVELAHALEEEISHLERSL